jgi:hypothetical protein
VINYWDIGRSRIVDKTSFITEITEKNEKGAFPFSFLYDLDVGSRHHYLPAVFELYLEDPDG